MEHLVTDPTSDVERTTEPGSREGRERIGYTVTYAYEHSPFYRALLDDHDVCPADVRTPEDLSTLPVVEGSDLRAHQPPETDEFLFRNPDADVRRPYVTAGTTGAPKTVFKGYDELDRIGRDLARGLEGVGVTDDDVVVSFFPFRGLTPGCPYAERGIEKLGAESIPIAGTVSSPVEEVFLLQRYHPSVIRGPPSQVEATGRRLRAIEGSPTDSGIDLVVLTGEPVSDRRKEYVADLYDARVTEYVGTSESGAFAWECREGEGFHVLEDTVHVEVVDGNGDPVPAGEEGRLVVTNLLAPREESAMPLVRYDLGDVTAVLDEDPSCGCPFAGTRTIAPPRRRGSRFTLGDVELTPCPFEERIYAHPDLRDAVTDYQVRVDRDSGTGRDVALLLVESSVDWYAGQVARDVTLSDHPSNVAGAVGATLLDVNRELRKAVDTEGGARIDVEVVTSMNPGTSRRLVDYRAGETGDRGVAGPEGE